MEDIESEVEKGTSERHLQDGVRRAYGAGCDEESIIPGCPSR